VVVLVTDPAGERLAAAGGGPAPRRPHGGATTAPRRPSGPHTILIAGPGTTGCYGPFPDGLHATAWAHRHIAGLDPRRYAVTAQPVAAPFDLTGHAPARTPPGPAAPGCHIVVLADGNASGAVGLFPDAPAAHAWADSQRGAITGATFTVVPVADPATFPAGDGEATT
jgi:hypothetical protein